MLINLDLESDIPIYTQLKNQIIEGIARKALRPGDDLPSVRGLASDLGINLHTVNKAYQQLKREGFILIHRQKGVVINPSGVPPADDEFNRRLEATLRPLVAEAVCRGITENEWARLSAELFNTISSVEEEK